MLNYLVFIKLIIILYIYKNSIKNGDFSCDNYILNIYSYILLSLIITFIICLYVNENKELFDLYINIITNNYYLIGYIIISILLIYIFHLPMIKYNIYYSHIIWLILLISISFNLIIITNLFIEDNILYKTIGLTIIAVLLTKLFVYLNQDLIKKYLSKSKMYIYIISLLIVILSSIILNFNNNISFENFNMYENYLLYIFVFIFIIFLMSDTQKILNFNMEDCKKSLIYCKKTQDKTSDLFNIKKEINCINNYPNYPLQSFSIYLDVINLFIKIGQINKK